MDTIIICFIVVIVILFIVLSYLTYLYSQLDASIHMQQPKKPLNNYIERSPPVSYSDKKILIT